MKLEWPTDRLDYVPITERPPLPSPGGAKVVIWPCVNVESWVIDVPIPRVVVNPPGGVAKSGWPPVKKKSSRPHAASGGRAAQAKWTRRK